MKYQAIIFDFDGVIFNSEPIHLEACNQVFFPLGFCVSEEEYFTKYVGLSDEKMFDLILKDRQVLLKPEQAAILRKSKIAAYKAIISQSASLESLPHLSHFIEVFSKTINSFAVCSGATREEIEATFSSPLALLRKLQANVAIGGYEFQNGRFAFAVLIRNSARTPQIEDFLSGILSPERLEHLGDRELNTAVERELSTLFPDQPRGQIQKTFVKFTRNADESHRHGGPMYRVAKAVGLEQLLIMSADDPLCRMARRGAHKQKKTLETQLANHIEMLIGAIFQDRGNDAVIEFVNRHWRKLGLNEEALSEDEFGASDEEVEFSGASCSSAYPARVSRSRQTTFPAAIAPHKAMLDYSQPPRNTALNFPLGYTPSMMCTLPNGNVIFGCYDGLHIMDLETSVCLKILEGHKQPISKICLLQGGNLVSASWDGLIKIWDTDRGVCLRTLNADTRYERDSIQHLLILPHDIIFTNHWISHLHVWNSTTGEEIAINENFQKLGGAFHYHALLPNGNMVIASSNNLSIWKVPECECLKTISTNMFPQGIKILSNDHILLHHSGSAEVWDLNEEKCVQKISMKSHISWNGYISSPQILPNGKVILVNNWGYQISEFPIKAEPVPEEKQEEACTIL